MFVVGLVDGDHHNLDGSQCGREYQAVVVSVGHDEGAHKAGGYAPGCGPDVVLLAFVVCELDVEALGEVLAEEVGRTGLKGLAVLHEGLDCHGVKGACKTLSGALVANNHGKGHDLTGELCVYVHHLLLAGFGFLCGGVCRMAFLPQEFRGTEEQAGAHFPADNVAPLVAQDGKVPPAVNPVLVGVPDNGFRGRADYQFFLKLGLRVHDYTVAVGVVHKAVVGYHCALLGESRHVFGLTAEKTLGDEQGEIGVLYAGFLEH